ncbi:delta and Notch-like epidermal growth factor-related receptor [Cyclospora cayetanensis]|uniref:Delta and Notch-like epidermal growth factor-related receptor n=1 Tax=Cyclospora cayetanensis TaxID=88456 RepID=A0A6P6RYK1_9EIME|nr:delta and Notch-like epidermal growth factor-related receptor [Cyclospora cayetanensis]
MCSNGCGIKSSTGIDCASALCSLGACLDTQTPPFYKCDCGDFFTGDNCETHNNPCTSKASNPCGQGTCTFAPGRGSGTVTCTCNDGYETAPGASMTTIKWGDSQVLQAAPCTVQSTRGMANIHFTLSSGELIFWWSVLAISLLVLTWCCYTVFSECCGSWSGAFRAAKAAKNAGL